MSKMKPRKKPKTTKPGNLSSTLAAMILKENLEKGKLVVIPSKESADSKEKI